MIARQWQHQCKVRPWPGIVGILSIVLACQGGGDSMPRVDTAAGAVGPDTMSTAPQPNTSAEVNYQVDPNNVAAALQWDSTTNTVTYPIVAGLTPTSGAWNFNGYTKGNMTIIVPVGARVVMPFMSLDGNVPHSMGIIAGEPNTATLAAAPDREPALPGAVSRRYVTGIRSTDRDIVRFTANQAGEFLLVCGVPGHAAAGMWIRFTVSADADRPEIRTND